MGEARPGGKAAVVTAVVCLLTAGGTFAVGPRGVLYSGKTSQGRAIKLVTDRAGVPKRGALDVVTQCSGDYKPFRTPIRIEKPFKRVSRVGFKVKGHRYDTDGTYSGHYHWKVEGKRKTASKFKGRIDVEIVFRRNDRKYTTCTAEGVTFRVKAGRDED